MKTSLRASMASSQVISGSGFAIAITSGWAFIETTISFETASFTDSPMKTSAPRMASSRVRIEVSRA